MLIYLVCLMLFSLVLKGSRPIISLYANSLGVDEITIGLMVSLFSLLPMLFAIRVGKWLDIVGAKKLIILGGVGMLVAFITPSISPSIITLFVSQLFIGLSFLSILVSLQKTVGNQPGNRDKIMALFSLTGSFGEFLGPLLSGFSYEYFGFSYTFAIAALITCLAISFIFFSKGLSQKSMEIDKKDEENKVSTIRLLQQVNLRKAVILSGLVIYSKDLFVSFFPLYGNQIGLSASHIGILLALMAGASVIVRVVQFQLVERFGRGTVITGTLLMSGFAYLAIPFGSNMIYLGALVIVLGLGLGLGQPISLVYALNISPKQQQGEVLGLRLTFNRGAQFFAPFLFGGVGSFFGLSPVFWISGILLIIGSKYTRIQEEVPELDD